MEQKIKEWLNKQNNTEHYEPDIETERKIELTYQGKIYFNIRSKKFFIFLQTNLWNVKYNQHGVGYSRDRVEYIPTVYLGEYMYENETSETFNGENLYVDSLSVHYEEDGTFANYMDKVYNLLYFYEIGGGN